jgi:hypothetical protein
MAGRFGGDDDCNADACPHGSRIGSVDPWFIRRACARVPAPASRLAVAARFPVDSQAAGA